MGSYRTTSARRKIAISEGYYVPKYLFTVEFTRAKRSRNADAGRAVHSFAVQLITGIRVCAVKESSYVHSGCSEMGLWWNEFV